MCRRTGDTSSSILLFLAVLIPSVAQVTAQDAFRKSATDRGFRAMDAGRYETAETLFLAAVKAGNRNGSRDAATVHSLRGLGLVRIHQGRHAEAVDILQQAVQLAESSEGPSTKLAADAIHDLASACAAAAEYENAEELYSRSRDLREELLGPGHPDVAASLNNLALLNAARGEYEEAMSLYEEAYSITGRALGPDHAESAAVLNNLAGCCWALGRYEDAAAFAARALKIRRATHGEEHPLVAACLIQEARILRAGGDYENAERAYRKVLQIDLKYFGAEHVESALQRRALALTASVAGRNDEAEVLLAQSLEVLRRQPRGDGSVDLPAMTRRGLELADAERFSEAEAALSTAWRISEQQYGPDAPETLRLLRLTADAIGAQGRSEERLVLRQWAEGGYGGQRTLNVARQPKNSREPEPSR
ncbi:MAG: tetratricopeptide repeat protein [Planctomycetota bacterium]